MRADKKKRKIKKKIKSYIATKLDRTIFMVF